MLDKLEFPVSKEHSKEHIANNSANTRVGMLVVNTGHTEMEDLDKGLAQTCSTATLTTSGLGADISHPAIVLQSKTAPYPFQCA